MTKFNSELSDQEKAQIVKNTFLTEKTEKNTVRDISNYLAKSFNKIDGFEYKWNSLITSTPLLFEDVDYVRIKSYVNNTITDEEKEAYKNGNLRELYATFESMLMCNLIHYDRIIRFCTISFLHYARLNDDEITSDHLDKVHYMLDMTPTQIWCASLSGSNSTEWELNYAWKINKNFNFVKPEVSTSSSPSIFELNYKLLNKNPIFKKFISYSSLIVGTTGFRQTFYSDKTSNRKLSRICSKFTSASTALSEDQLNTIYEYINEQETINNKLYGALFKCLKKMFNDDETQFAIYVYSKEFFIHTSKFSMKVTKTDDGKITKDYLANSYECFVAEESLFESIKIQIEWAKYVLPSQFKYDKKILVSLLNKMLVENYKEIICIKRMNEYGILSKITFSGVFNNVYINEDLMFNNRTIKSSRKCLSKENASNYIVDRGYYIFGIEKDIYEFSAINKQSIFNHYGNYCIPVMEHMSSVITSYVLNKNDIIDFVVNGILNPNKINNKNIRYTEYKNEINPRKIMQVMFEKTNENYLKNTKKSYWKVVDS